MREIEKLNPFGKFCIKIGMIPSSYTEAMTYEEQLLFFCDFLENKVIPALDNNADAIIELQEYVKSYFTNLDVQDEINKKLDKMASDGSLTLLIKNYLDPLINEQEKRIANQDIKITSIDNKVNSIASGSPSGTYATLQDLIDADPNHSKIYVVLATGNWYYYDETTSSWTSGGTYQSTSIADNSITYKKLSNDVNYYKKYVKNLEYVENHYITSAGNVGSLNGWHYAEVKYNGGKLYFSGNIRQASSNKIITFYRTNTIAQGHKLGEFIPDTPTVDLIEIPNIPEGTQYITISNGSDSQYYNDLIEIPIIEERTNLFVDIIKNSSLENLIFTDNLYIGHNGNINVSNNSSITQTIKVKGNKLYIFGNLSYLSAMAFVSFFRTNNINSNSFISEYVLPSAYNIENGFIEVDVPTGANYFIISSRTTYKNTLICYQNKIENNYKSIDNKINVGINLTTSQYTKTNIKLIGDSITAGVGGTGYSATGETIYGDFKVNEDGYCWANELKGYLESKYNVSVKNFGISGRASCHLVEHMAQLINDEDDLIICMIGTNDRNNSLDTISGQTRTQIQTLNNLHSIYNYVKAQGKEIIFISPIPSSINDENDDKHCHMEDINNLIANLCGSINCQYIDLYNAFIEYCDLKGITIDSLLNDGLHPNDNGYEVMFKLILKGLNLGVKRPGANW